MASNRGVVYVGPGKVEEPPFQQKARFPSTRRPQASRAEMPSVENERVPSEGGERPLASAQATPISVC
jgi:hypothetical protein